jgi:signal transduction histidine kinase
LNIAVVVAVLFVASMLFLISGLVLFLREVRIATARMRQGMETLLANGSDPQARS